MRTPLLRATVSSILLGLAMALPCGAADGALPSAQAKLANAYSAFCAARFEDSARSSREIIAATTDPEVRIEAVNLLAQSVRSLSGYSAAMKEIGDLRASVQFGKEDVEILDGLMARLKDGQAVYQKSSSEQAAVVKSAGGVPASARECRILAGLTLVYGTATEVESVCNRLAAENPNELTAGQYSTVRELAVQTYSPVSEAAGDSERHAKDLSKLDDALSAYCANRYQEAARIAEDLLASDAADVRSGAISLQILCANYVSGYQRAVEKARSLEDSRDRLQLRPSDLLAVRETMSYLAAIRGIKP